MPVPSVLVEIGNDVGDWFDITQYVDLRSNPVTITRGRQEEVGNVDPSTCTLTLDNGTGRFTPGKQPVNLLPNPSGEAGVASPWVADAGNPDVGAFNGTGVAMYGTRAIRVISSVTGTMVAALAKSSWIPVNAGASYALQAWFRTAGLSGTRQTLIRVWWYDASGAYLGFSNASLVNATSTYQRSSGVITAPATAAYARPHASIGATAANETFYVDGIMMETGSMVSNYSDAVPIRIGTPLRVSATVNSVTRRRFTGTVNGWPTTWPTGHDGECTSTITASDFAAALARRKFRSVIEQTILPLTPAAYYVLGEAQGAVTAGDSSGRNQPAMTIEQRGSGGTLEFGAGTGPGTDGRSAPTFTPVDPNNGKYLRAAFPAAVRESLGLFSVHATYNSETVAAGTVFRVTRDPTNFGVSVDVDSSGRLRFWNGAALITHASNTCDGQTHSIVLVLASVTDNGAGSDFLWRLYRDGNLIGSTTTTNSSFPITRLYVGGGPLDTVATGTISHVALFPTALSAVSIGSIAVSVLTGWTTDSSDARMNRYAEWAGIDIGARLFDTGELGDVAHQDTNGMRILEAMQAVADAEGGLLFVNGDGQLVFHSRRRRYGATVAMTFDVGKEDLGTDAEFSLDSQRLVNAANASRPNGAVQRVEAPSSIARYGEFPTDVSILVTTDDDAFQAASWMVNTRSEPQPRLVGTSADLLSQPATFAATAQALELDSLIEVIGLPSQAPYSSARLFVEGWTEELSTSSWSMSLNTSPLVTVWKVGDPTYGQVDKPANRIAY